MRQWTTRNNYTAIEYKGLIPTPREGWGEPRTVTLVMDGVVVPCRIDEDTAAVIASEEGRDWTLQFLYHQLYGRLPFPTALEAEIIHRSFKNRHSKVVVNGRAVNPEEWPEPPHVEFANCDFKTAEDVKRFVEDYGVSFLMCDYVRSSKEMSQGELNPIATVERMQQFQGCFRAAWKAHADALKQIQMWIPTTVNFTNGRPHLICEDIWEYMCALLLIDRSDDRLRICDNPQCKLLKYFVANRKDQKFCSDTCRNTVNINLWLADPENRKRWNEERRKSREKNSGEYHEAQGLGT